MLFILIEYIIIVVIIVIILEKKISGKRGFRNYDC